ncbi:MAG: cytochrome c class I NirC [Pseudomonadales bacterium]|nr:cytochrome c class I NirC [Pseudomonadales bacterium]
MNKLSVRTALIASVTILLHNNAVAEVSKQRGEEIRYTVRQDCGSCHGLTLAGGLGPDLKAKRLQALPDNYLSKVIKEGIPNTPMPPWQEFFNDEEIQWIVTHLKRGTL